MVRSTGNLHYNLTAQGLSDAGHILPAVISMTQTAVIAAPPGVHLAIGRENHSMARTTSNLRNTDTSKSINECGFVLVAILYGTKGGLIRIFICEKCKEYQFILVNISF